MGSAPELRTGFWCKCARSSFGVSLRRDTYCMVGWMGLGQYCPNGTDIVHRVSSASYPEPWWGNTGGQRRADANQGCRRKDSRMCNRLQLGRRGPTLAGNGCRVVERVSGACSVQVLRGSLKELYCRCRSWMEDRGLAMVDLHELIRLHGQMVCTKVPKCSICPVSTCRSRRVEHQTGRFPAVSPEIWQDWRELLLEPTSSKGS